MDNKIIGVIKSGLIGISVVFLYNLFILAFVYKYSTGRELYNFFLFWTLPSFLVGVFIKIIFSNEERNLIKSYAFSYLITASIMTISSYIYWTFTGHGQFKEFTLYGLISINLIILSVYIVTFVIYFVYELTQLERLNRKLLNYTSIKKFINIDKNVTGIFMSLYCILIIFIPIANDSPSFFSFDSEDFMYIIDLKYGFLLMILLFIGSISVLVLSIQGIKSKNIILNTRGILIAATAELLSSFIIIISVIFIYPELSITIWPFIHLSFGIIGYLDVLLFKKFY